MRPIQMLSTLLVAAVVGCGAPEYERTISYKSVTEPQSARPAPAADSFAGDRSSTTREQLAHGNAMSPAVPQGGGGQGAPSAESPALARKIIYDADIDVVVEDVDSVAKRVARIVQDTGGYIAEQSVSGSPGAQRSMRWKLRVPVDRFETLVEQVIALGELNRNTRTSQDVTEQYYDIEARIKNKKAEEKTLTKILDERTGKLEDVLRVETELSRVRGEIEQLEGKIRVLENLSALATLTLNVREREKYEPPPPVAADFPTQVGRTWDASLNSLVDLGKGVVLWAVNWAVWIPLIILEALVAWLVLRWLIRRLIRNLPRLIALAHTPITPPKSS
jgi:hypothetical protein